MERLIKNIIIWSYIPKTEVSRLIMPTANKIPENCIFQ